MMERRRLGQSELTASAIGLGTWAIGGTRWGGSDEASGIAAIRTALDAGVDLIDTAPLYGWGRSEEIVGKAIRGRRDDVVLATKCGLMRDGPGTHVLYHENGTPVHVCLRPRSIRSELERSLIRLGTDRIDLYQTHAQDPKTPISETMAELLRLKDEGKIRAIGVSNVTREQLAEYARSGPVATAQERYSMLDREIESELLPACRAHGVALLAYSPLGLGVLSGRVLPDATFPADDQRASDPRFERSNLERVHRLLDDFRPLAETHSATLAQLAVAWVLTREGVGHALVGARRPAHARENAGAADVALSDSELARIEQALERHADAIR